MSGGQWADLSWLPQKVFYTICIHTYSTEYGTWFCEMRYFAILCAFLSLFVEVPSLKDVLSISVLYAMNDKHFYVHAPVV